MRRDFISIIHSMGRKYLFITLLSGSLVAICGVNRALADFSCRAEVSYKWARLSKSEVVSQGLAGKDGQTPPGTPSAAQGESLVVRMIAVERLGKDQDAAKLALEAELNRQRVRASEVCLRDHEGFGACVARKLSVHSSVLNSLSFSARAELETALTEECQGQQGRCLGVEVSEPQCKEVVGAEPTPPPDTKKADAKKK